MKINFKYTLLIPSLMLMLATSCFKDKGNYDYTNIHEAVIDFPAITDNEYEITADWLTDLVLTPQVKTPQGTDANLGDYDFEWYNYSAEGVHGDDGKYVPKKVIGHSAGLNFYLGDPPGKYYYVLKSTHKTTAAVSFYRFLLNVESVNGWLVLDENAASEGDLHIIRDQQIVPSLTLPGAIVGRNMYSLANNNDKLTGAKFISILDVSQVKRYHNLYVFKENGVYKIDAGTFTLVTEDYNALFMSSPSVAAPMAHFYPNGMNGRSEVLINNNEIYVQRWSGLGLEDKFPSVWAAFGTPYKVHPYIAYIDPSLGGNVAAVLYQTHNYPRGRFITVGTSGSSPGYLSLPEGSQFQPQAINSDPTVSNLVLRYMNSGTDGKTVAVFHDELDSNKPWLLVGNFINSAEPAALRRKNMSEVTGFAAATHYVFGQRGDLVFYASGDKVYSYSFMSDTATASVMLSLSGSEQVTSMKLYTHSNNETYSGRILFVATYDGTQGKVYKIPFNPLNGNVGNVEIFDGFGKIIDMYNKE